MRTRLQNKLDDMFMSYVEQHILVGADIAVIHDGEQIYRRSWGWKDRENAVRMTSGSIFRYASLTKIIVSAVALRLNELRIINLDAPVTRYLPDFRPALLSGETPGITVRQLMTHMAGLTYGFLQEQDGSYRRAGVSDGLDGAGISNAENIRRISSLPLSYTPGERWGYSVATDVLGAVLEGATENDLETLVRHYVTRPLEMENTNFMPCGWEKVAIPYRDGTPTPVRMQADEWIAVGPESAAHFEPYRACAAGTGNSGGAGLFGTVDDYVRFLEAIRRRGNPILTAASVQELITNAVGSLNVTPPGPGWGFGLGVAVLLDPVLAHTPQAKGTWHWSGAYGNYWFVDPIRKLTVVMLTNTAFAGMAGEVPDNLRDCVYKYVQ